MKSNSAKIKRLKRYKMFHLIVRDIVKNIVKNYPYKSNLEDKVIFISKNIGDINLLKKNIDAFIKEQGSYANDYTDEILDVIAEMLTLVACKDFNTCTFYRVKRGAIYLENIA